MSRMTERTCLVCGEHFMAPEDAQEVVCPACGKHAPASAAPVQPTASSADVSDELPEIVLRCATCRGPARIPAGELMINCPFCGQSIIRQKRKSRSKILSDALNRANTELINKDWQAAEEDFRSILMQFPEEHEALWGRLLCRYGVEYVKDTRTGSFKPTLHFTYPGAMVEEADFKAACKHAPDDAVRRQYEADARYIDQVQAAIREKVMNDPGVEVFICHKTTKTTGFENGVYSDEKTRDYESAKAVYNLLRENHYKTFFAPEAGLKPGTNYEAGIYHALDTAKVMLLVCQTAEYLNTAWVKSEWSRFLEMIKRGGDQGDKLLVPLIYAEFDRKKLPEEIKARSLQDISITGLSPGGELLEFLREHLRKHSPEEDFDTGLMQDGCEVKRYTGHDSNVSVPPVIRGRKVLAMSSDAFADNKTLQTVTLPESLMELGEGAFRGCDALAEIRVEPGNGCFEVKDGMLRDLGGVLLCCPAGLNLTKYRAPADVRRIGAYAFSGCASLQRVEIPWSVRFIGERAFAGCMALAEALLPEPEPAMGEDVFADCPKLLGRDFQTDRLEDGSGCILTRYTGKKTDVTVPGVIDGLPVVQIGNAAFSDCFDLKRVTLPEGVKRLGAEAFQGCSSLTGVILPSTLEEIGARCFSYCDGLTELRLPAGLKRISGDVLMGVDRSVSLCVRKGSPSHDCLKQMGFPFTELWSPEKDFETSVAEKGCTITRYNGSEAEVWIPPMIGERQVVAIGPAAFNSRAALHTVIVPEGLTTLGRNAFYRCVGLQRVQLPESLTRISWRSFGDCIALMYLIIPDGVTMIEDGAFSGCASLTIRGCAGGEAEAHAKKAGIRFELRPAPEKDFTTTSVSGGCCITGYTGSEPIVVVPETIGGQPVVAIGDRAFQEKKDIVRIALPEGIRSIGGRAFARCEKLQEVNIPAAVTELPVEVFLCCKALREVTLPAQLRRIGHYAFSGCSSLTDVKLPSTVTMLGTAAFSDCAALQTMELPEGLKTLLGEAFLHCEKLQEIRLPAQLKTIGPRAFDGCAVLGETELPAAVTKIGQGAFANCPQLKLRVYSESEGEAYAEKNQCLAEVIISYAEEADFRTKLTGQDGCVLTDYTGKAAKLRVPPVIGGRRVVEIGKDAFRGKQTVATVILPEGVEKIAENAFDRCIALERLEVPASLKKIANTALRGCRALKTVTVAEGNEAFTCRDGLLLDADGMLVRCLPGYSATVVAFPEKVCKVGAGAFEGCKDLKVIRFSREVEAIAGNALYACPAALHVPEDSFAHLYCVEKGLSCIVFDKKRKPAEGEATPVAAGEGLYVTEPLKQGSVIKEGFCKLAHYNGTDEDVMIPEQIGDCKVSAIGVGSFERNSTLRSVIIPETVERISGKAFAACPELKLVMIPASVQLIALDSFQGSENVTLCGYAGSVAEQYAKKNKLAFEPVEVPATGDGADQDSGTWRRIALDAVAFMYGGWYGTLAVEGTRKAIRSGKNPAQPDQKSTAAASSAAKKTAQPPKSEEASLYTPEEAFVFDAESGTIKGYTGDDKVVRIPPKIGGKVVKIIGEAAFKENKKITGVYLPKQIRSIEYHAFDGCSKLVYVGIEEGVEKLSGGVFRDCTSLRKITLPASIKTTGMFLLQRCTALREAIIKSQLEELNEYAFSDCKNLVRVELPPTLNKIAAHAFDGCSSLEYLEIPASVQSYGQNAFNGCDKLPESIRKLSPNRLIGALGKWFFG